jgi:hypothetical protein
VVEKKKRERERTTSQTSTASSPKSQIETPFWQAGGGGGGTVETLSRTPLAPPRRHDRSLEKAAKNRGRPFWGPSSDERVSERRLFFQGFTQWRKSSYCQSCLGSPDRYGDRKLATFCSTRLRFRILHCFSRLPLSDHHQHRHLNFAIASISFRRCSG